MNFGGEENAPPRASSPCLACAPRDLGARLTCGPGGGGVVRRPRLSRSTPRYATWCPTPAAPPAPRSGCWLLRGRMVRGWCAGLASPGALCLGAALSGILSFGLLAVAIGTDYWYLIRVEPLGRNGSAWQAEQLSSHSGLWRLCEGRNACMPLIDPFGTESWQVPSSLQYLICMHRAFVVLLPLSLISLVFIWICGIISSLARSSRFLLFTGCYFLQGALLTLAGTTVYICYSRAAFTETVRMFDRQRFEHVHIAFGWSLALAWLSFGTEVLAGILLLLAAWGLSLTPDPCSVVI
ncbi:transmembrane protein 235 [Heteronotia binoei]|uniref:transmembrane protein 235 n=1 Tax=Heteronotia binoei TaxID=13085 RepID=UPI00292E11FB|nr:transmembrane protein 235 [Heteronotia binoei]